MLSGSIVPQERQGNEAGIRADHYQSSTCPRRIAITERAHSFFVDASSSPEIGLKDFTSCVIRSSLRHGAHTMTSVVDHHINPPKFLLGLCEGIKNIFFILDIDLQNE